MWRFYTEKREFDQYDCFSDPGERVDFKHIHAMYPDAIFLLTIRNYATWLASNYRHVLGNRRALNCTDEVLIDNCPWNGDPALEWRSFPHLEGYARKQAMYITALKSYFEGSGQLHVLHLEESSTWKKQLGSIFNATFQHTYSFSYSVSQGFAISDTGIQIGTAVAKDICRKDEVIRAAPELCSSGRNNSLELKIPTVINVGIQKAGTSALFSILHRHPEVASFTNFKAGTGYEVHYFDTVSTPSLAGYAHFLQDIPVTNRTRIPQILFEKTPNYFTLADTIASHVPKSTKIIILLRNPVDRFFSAFQHGVRDGWQDIPETIDDCFPQMSGRCAHRDCCAYLHNEGKYVELMDKWVSNFDDVFIGFYEEMWLPEYDWSILQRFLNLSQPLVPIGHRVNDDKTHAVIPEHIKVRLTSYYKPYNEQLCTWFKTQNRKCPMWSLTSNVSVTSNVSTV